MTPDIKRQLEGEADCHPFTNTYDAYMAGAEAAWELATKVTEDDDGCTELFALDWVRENAQMADHENDYADCFSAGFSIGRRGLREAVKAAVKRERERCLGIVNRRLDYALSIKGSDSYALLTSAKFTIQMCISTPTEDEAQGILNPTESGE